MLNSNQPYSLPTPTPTPHLHFYLCNCPFHWLISELEEGWVGGCHPQAGKLKLKLKLDLKRMRMNMKWM